MVLVRTFEVHWNEEENRIVRFVLTDFQSDHHEFSVSPGEELIFAFRMFQEISESYQRDSNCSELFIKKVIKSKLYGNWKTQMLGDNLVYPDLFWEQQINKKISEDKFLQHRNDTREFGSYIIDENLGVLSFRKEPCTHVHIYALQDDLVEAIVKRFYSLQKENYDNLLFQREKTRKCQKTKKIQKRSYKKLLRKTPLCVFYRMQKYNMYC
jgi:hypothetical protein